jgi:hypothetical protein
VVSTVVDDQMQVKISRCVAVDLAYKPRADANHFTIACACQRTASVRLSIAVLVSTWLIIAAASSVLPARCRRSQSSAAVLDLIAESCSRLVRLERAARSHSVRLCSLRLCSH